LKHSKPTNKKLIDFFPKDATPRPQQLEALEKIQKGFDNNKKFVIACLPTGSGKSHVGYSMGLSANEPSSNLVNLINDYSVYKKNKYGEFLHEEEFLNAPSFGSFILTITKSLQEQYQNLFLNIPVLKGKNNYACDVNENFTAENAPCLCSNELKQKCFIANRCPYYRTRNHALSSLCPVLNYRVFFNLPNFLKKREIFICDEASGLEDELVAKYTLSVDFNFLQNEKIKFRKILTEDEKDWYDWLVDVHTQVETKCDELRNLIDIKNDNVRDMGRLTKLNRLNLSLKSSIERWNECEFLLEKRNKDVATFTPYNIKPIAKELFDSADRVLMMSATISNHQIYAKSLGITNYEYFEANSLFDVKKSPIRCSRKHSLSYSTLEKNLPKVIDIALSICDKHKNEKGVIHTHTNSITEKLKNAVGDDPRFLFKSLHINNEMLLEKHKNDPSPTILVSPSLDVGISLDDDLGRFQIIMKAPYLPLNSKRIKKMFEKSPKHYAMKMLDKLIQMSGRCTRSIEDYSITYILDAVAVNAVIKEKKHLPKHFLERVI